MFLCLLLRPPLSLQIQNGPKEKKKKKDKKIFYLLMVLPCKGDTSFAEEIARDGVAL